MHGWIISWNYSRGRRTVACDTDSSDVYRKSGRNHYFDCIQQQAFSHSIETSGRKDSSWVRDT